jgi:TRAP-type transport system periplasmic protein
MKNLRSGILLASLMLILVLVSMSFLAGCSSPTPSTTAVPPKTTTTAPTTTAAPPPTTSAPAPATSAPVTSAAAKPIVLKVAPTTLQASPNLGMTLTISTQLKLIENRTNGRVKFDIYWGQTLASATELSGAINSGLADMAILRPYGEPGKLPLASVGEMPGISEDQWALLWAYYDLFRQDPILSELAKYKMKPLWVILTQNIDIISRTPIASLADLKGKKIAAGGIAADEIKTLGGVPVSMTPTEQGEGMRLGTIEGAAAPLDASYSFKFYDSGKYITKMYLGPRIQPFVINQDVWNSLPADIQKVFNDSMQDMVNLTYTTIMKDSNEPIMKEMTAAGVQFLNLSAADMAQVKSVQAAYADSWASKQTASADAKKALDDYRAFAAKYEKTSPYKK